jgi:DNA-binding beta-propeller fold protein YncE
MRFQASGTLLTGILALIGCGGGTQNPAAPGGEGNGNNNSNNQTASTPFVYVSNTGSDTISGFAIDAKTGELRPVAGSPFATPAPAGLARDRTGKYITVANVNKGLSVIGTAPQTGALSDLHCIDREAPGAFPCYPFPTGTKGTPRFVTAKGETIYIGNVGSDDISVYIQDPPNGDLGTSIPSEFAAGIRGLRFLDFVGGKLWAAGDSGIARLRAPGSINVQLDFVLDRSVGYRAAAMHGSGNYLYAIDANDAVHDFCLHSQCALGEENQVPVASPQGASSIAVQGNFAYVTHSTSRDISIYSIDPGSCSGNTCTVSGALTFLTSIPAGGGASSARVFLGKFLYVANSADGTVSGYRIDDATGLLTPVPGLPVHTGANPVFIAAP